MLLLIATLIPVVASHAFKARGTTLQSGPAPPVVTRPPPFSWQTLGDMAFLHAGSSRAYTPADLALVQRFPMVQFDKQQFLTVMPGASQEDRFIAAATQIKALPSVATRGTQMLMYINGLINFPAGRLFNATPSELLLVNSAGKPCLINRNSVFDMRKPAMRRLFVEDALYGMASGAFDGVFIDRANWAEQCDTAHGWDHATCTSLVPAQRQLFVELTAALGTGNLTLAKEHKAVGSIDWQVANAAMLSDAFCSSYCHGCNASVTPGSRWKIPSDAQECKDAIAAIADMAARGQLSQSHAMGPVSGAVGAEARKFVMAAFLVAAGNLSYFSYANWARDCWTLDGTQWWTEYDKPLGTPTSPANFLLPGKRWKYARNFSSGTTVYVDVATREVEIVWGGKVR